MSQRHFVSTDPPQVVSDRIVSAMQVVLPDWLADESDPGVYWADATAYELTQWGDQADVSLAGAFPATATGEALDQHLATWGLPAQANDETTEQARARLRSAILSLRPDTPEFYLAQVEQWDADQGNDPPLASDISTEWVIASLELLVYILTETGPLMWAPLSQANADSLQTYLASVDGQSLLVSALVVNPNIVDLTVRLEVVFGADVLTREALLAEVRNACQGYLNSRARLDTDISYSDMVAAGKAVSTGVSAVRVLVGTDDPEEEIYVPALPSALYRATIVAATDVTP